MLSVVRVTDGSRRAFVFVSDLALVLPLLDVVDTGLLAALVDVVDTGLLAALAIVVCWAVVADGFLFEFEGYA